MKYTLFLSCIRGFEDNCKQDIEQHGIEDVSIADGGIQFTGVLSDIYKINYSSRYGMHLYWEISNFAFNEKKLSNDIYKINWDKYFNNIHSFSIKVNSTDRSINTQYTTLVVKDGIADYFNKKYGRRPNVDRKTPDIPIYIYIDNDNVKVYIDTSGEPLYKRGYRTDNIHAAPLNEVLASNIINEIKLEDNSLYDPMCGSGTLLIEAALKAANIPSQICRKKFSFMNWFNYDSDLYNKIRKELQDNIIDTNLLLYGSDNDESSLEMTIGSVKKLNLDKYITVRRRNFFDFIPKPDSTIIFNPPYDIRLSIDKDLDEYYEKIGYTLKKNCKDTIIHIFTIENNSLEYIDIPCLESKKIKNGNLDCLLNKYKI